MKLRFENYTEAHTHMIAIKDVYLGGPAHHAGLHPHCDFILGTPELLFKEIHTFAKYLNVNKGQTVQLIVYNVTDETVRDVFIEPNDTWGSQEQGLIGAEVCMGLLTGVPSRKLDLKSE